MSNSKKLRLNSLQGLKLIVIILLLACSIDAPVQAQSAPRPSRDWTRYPAVVEVDTVEDFAAVSDPHGDYDRLLRVLGATGWISGGLPQPRWSGGESVLIVLGDLIDKGRNSLKVIELLRALQKDASYSGGRVIVTMGNHEAEFLADWRADKTQDFQNELKQAAASQNKPELNPERVANCEGELGQWLCQLPVAVRVNDWFFCHAGNTANRSISDINRAIKTGFEQNGFKTDELIGSNSILGARLDGPKKKLWFMEGNSKTNPEEVLRRYANSLAGPLKVNHIVQGHKPGDVDFPGSASFPNGAKRNRGDIFQAYNGLLFLIDNDMSSGSSERIGAVLSIRGHRQDNVRAHVTCPNPNYWPRAALWEITKPVAFSGLPCGAQ